MKGEIEASAEKEKTQTQTPFSWRPTIPEKTEAALEDMSESEQLRPEMAREVGTADMMENAFHIYSRNFLQYFLPFLLMGLLSKLLNYYMFPVGFAGDVTDITPAAALATVFSLVISFLLSNVANGMVIKLTSEIVLKGKGNLTSSLSHAMRRTRSLLVASILFALAVGFGLVLLVVPGIILFIIFCLTNQFVMLEEKGAMASFESSRSLISGNWGRAFYLMLFLAVIIFMTSFAGDIAAEYVGDFAGQIVNSVVSALVEPLWPISFTILYHHLKSRKPQIQKL
ncbi:MAG TPA: hypothetical protein VJ574_08310 [Candidatus Bathyarchaeia archaeon]|nr:hypothetical protein [Candidatus Bathyarchaeia archaeon]